MLKYIFKNYDKFLESNKIFLTNLFARKRDKNRDSNLQLKPDEILELEIKRQEENLKQKTDPIHKLEIRKNILYLYLKKKALKSTCKYIKRANDILRDEVDDSAYEALNYLSRVPKKLSSEHKKELHIYRAYIHEILEEYDEASTEYKMAIKYDKTAKTLTEFKKFVVRSREALTWDNKGTPEELLYSVANIHNTTKLEDMPKVTKSLEDIAKYYARSPKSRSLGKRYFREVVKMYKKLSEHEPKKYTCKYAQSLIDAVEIFMMHPNMLKEANDILTTTYDCVEDRVQLLGRIKRLKQKGFIKKSRVFE